MRKNCQVFKIGKKKKRYTGSKYAHKKNTQPDLSLGECKLKLQWDTTMHQLECQRF